MTSQTNAETRTEHDCDPWMDRTVVIAGTSVRVSVRRLERDAREGAAATIAWFSNLLLTTGATGEHDDWRRFLQSVMDQVRFTTMVDVDAEALSDSWWQEASSQGLAVYMDLNELTPLWRRHLDLVSRTATGTAGAPTRCCR